MEEGWSMPPLLRIQRCLLCPCGAGTCRLMTSSTSTNPGRRFYKCPAPEQCRFFKWADSVKANEFIDVPYCGGCVAGPCRVRLEMNGPSAGRILFMCTIKEGQGSCGYRVFQDELEMSLRRGQVNSTTTSPPPMTSTSCNGNPPPNINLADENIPIKNIQDDQSSVTSTPLRPKSCRTTSRKTKQSKLLEDELGEVSRSPLKRLRNGNQVPASFVSAPSHTIRLVMNPIWVKEYWWMSVAIHQNLGPELKGWWGRLAFYSLPRLVIPAPEPTDWRFSLLLDPLVMVHGNKQVISDASTTLMLDSNDVQNDNMVNTGSSATITTSPISVCIAEPENGVNPFPVDHHETLHNEPFEKNKFNSALSDSVSKAFRFAAEQLQNDLFTLLEKADSKDHETMKQAAEATFAALDHLCIDYHHLEKRVNEFIGRSISLTTIEQSMVINDSYQELELQCQFKRMKLDEMECAHTKAVDNVIRSRKSLEVLQDVICAAKEWLFQVEAEYLSLELELKDMEVQLEHNFAEKQVLEGKYLIASKELEDFVELHKQLEAAKADYGRAKALLRG